MEFDVSSSSGDNDHECMALNVPEEIWIKIIMRLEPLDILSLARTCRFLSKLSDNDHVWRCQWINLSSELPFFSFPSVHNLTTLGVQFKDSCRRLWSIASNNRGLYPKCVHCNNHSCVETCLEVNTYFCFSSRVILFLSQEWSSKIVLDIGGKWTWCVSANLGLKKHMSMIAVPKLLRCYDCDSVIDRTRTQVHNSVSCLTMILFPVVEAHCDCHCDQDSASVTRVRSRGLYCKNRSVASHTGLEYCSQQLEQLHHQQYLDR